MSLKSFIYLIVFSTLSSIATAQLSCKSIFQNKSSVALAKTPKFMDFKNEILKLKDISFYWGEFKPTWEQYNQLKNILKKAKQINSQNRSSQFSEEQIQILKSELQTWAINLHQKALKIEPDRKLIDFIDSNYGYFKLYEKINLEVGLNIFPLRFLDLVAPTKTLVSDAEKTVAGNEVAISELFETTGYKSKSAYLKYVKSHSKKANRLLDLAQNHLVVAIHRPESARFWIPVTGFQNQRVTGTSKGSYGPNHRNQVESQLTFQQINKYSEKSVRYMPNYGEARPENGSKEFLPNQRADSYGSDLWIIKKELYESRATWTPRDSFGQSRATSRRKVTSWNQMFIPWKDRELMVPYALSQIIIYDVYGRSKKVENNFTPNSIPEDFILNGERYGSSYFEVQIWGPLTLDDVQAFHFKENPPDKELYDVLVSKGIEVWDERTWPAKKYSGEKSK